MTLQTFSEYLHRETKPSGLTLIWGSVVTGISATLEVTVRIRTSSGFEKVTYAQLPESLDTGLRE